MQEESSGQITLAAFQMEKSIKLTFISANHIIKQHLPYKPR